MKRAGASGVWLLVSMIGCSGETAPSLEAGAGADAGEGACHTFFPDPPGCVGSPTLSVMSDPVHSTAVDAYRCAAYGAPATVRLAACVVPPRTCAPDDGVTYCVVVELDRATLPALVGAEVRLDGEARFVYPPEPSVRQVQPSDVTYVAVSPTAGVRRVWMEKGCFCTPASTAATQTLTGTLRLVASSTGRVRGRLSVDARGAIAPTTWNERVALAAEFDVAIEPAP